METLKNDYFKTVLRTFENVGSLDDIATHFYHPKLVFIHETQIQVIDVESAVTEDVAYHTESPVRCSHVKKQFLWVMLENGQLKIYNLFNASSATINFQNRSFRVKKLRSKDEDIVFVSESGDYFTSSPSLKEIIELSQKSDGAEMEASYKKISVHDSTLTSDKQRIGGTTLLLAKHESKSLIAECKNSGLQISLRFDGEVGKFSTFRNSPKLLLQIKNEITQANNLVLICLESFNEVETSIETLGYPIGGNYDIFYYVSLEDGFVNINCVKRHEPLKVACALASCGKFDEAHDYALKNDLDVQPLLQMKLTGLINNVLNGEKVELVTLSEVFEQITDLELLIDQLLKLFHYSIAYKSLALNLKTRCAKECLILEKLQLILAKLDIVEFISVRGGCDYIDNPLIFQLSLEDLCIKFVSNGDVDVAAVVYSKFSVINHVIDNQAAIEILNATPQLIKLNALMVWLKIFFPPILREIPFFVDSIVKWAVGRVFSLEKSKYWPDIGIKFTENILQVLDDSCFAPTNVRPSSFDKLNLLGMHMKTVKHLKEKYRVNLLIKELTVETPADIVKIILHRCYTEDLKSLMEEYLPGYSSRHGLDYDTLLRDYADQLMAASAVDDTRLPLVVKAMYSNEHRVDCILHVIENIEVPWSESIYQLAVEAATANNESSKKVQVQIKYAKLKMVLRKYNYPLSTSEYESVLIKIVNSTPVELEDLKIVVDVVGRLKDYANFLYVEKCLLKSHVKAALQYCAKLEISEKKNISKSIALYLESLIMEENCNIEIPRNYLDFLKGLNMLSDTQLSNFTKIYHLKSSYEILMSSNEYCVETKRIDAFTKWCAHNGLTLSSNVYYLKSVNLSSVLAIKRRTAIPIIIANMKDKFHQTTLRAMLRLSDDLLLENFVPNFDLSVFFEGKEAALLQNYIKMFTDFTINCNEELLHFTLKTLSMLVSINNCKSFVDNTSNAWKFHYIYMPVSTYSSMNDMISFYNKINTTVSNEVDLIKSVPVRNDLVPLRMISEISNIFMSKEQPIPTELKDTREKLVKKMLTKILLSQHCDNLLVTSLLYMLPVPNDWLRELYDSQSGENASLINYMAIAEKTLGFRDLLPRSTTSYQQVLKSKHNLDITDYICSDDIFETTNFKFLLFNVLKARPDMDMDSLKDICRTLNMSLNEALTVQVITLISTWELKHNIFKDSLGSKQIEIKNDEKNLQARCLVLIESIKSKEFLVESLKELWSNGELNLGGQVMSINSYHHEIFICIYNLLNKLVSDWKAFKEYLILLFLKHYRRVTSPRQTEMDIFSVKGSFPEIGYYRLPFHMFIKEDMWANLKYEITLKSYAQWLPIVTLLKLDKDVQTAKDMLCSTAVKQSMTQQKLDNDSTAEQWNLFIINQALLKEAHQCVQHISNMEWAAACLFFVLQGTKRGADQLTAAELTYQFAQQWAKIQPNNNAVKKMEYKYCTLNTMHILHKMGFTEERFLQLCTDPNNLIKTLYADRKYNESMLEFDVNKSIDEIADKNGVNINSVRHQILEYILDQKGKRNSDTYGVGLDPFELAKARYIFKATCPNIGAIYLAKIGLDTDNDFNKGKKLRALQCLMSIADPEVLQKIINMDRSALKTALLDLYFSIELEKIDMPFLVATFVEDKQRALQQIWQTAEKNKETLRVVAKMGAVYPINDEIVQQLLQALIRYDLVDELALLLPNLRCTPTEVFEKAWSRVLLTPFEKTDYPVGERQRMKCLKAINMLPQCPKINENDLINIWHNCVRCKCVELGCLILPYLNEQKRISLVDWKKFDRRNLIAGVKNLHAETYLVIAALSVVDSLTSNKV